MFEEKASCNIRSLLDPKWFTAERFRQVDVVGGFERYCRYVRLPWFR